MIGRARPIIDDVGRIEAVIRNRIDGQRKNAISGLTQASPKILLVLGQLQCRYSVSAGAAEKQIVPAKILQDVRTVRSELKTA